MSTEAHAPWSLSKAELAAKCALAFKFQYVDKVKRVDNTYARVGVAAHRVQELVLQDVLPREALAQALVEYPELTSKEQETVRGLMPAYEGMVTRVAAFKAKYDIVDVLTEVKWGVTKDFTGCAFDAPDVFYRGVVDLGLCTSNGYVIIVDHKSGRRRPIDYQSKQLDSYAVLAHANLPGVRGVQAAIHYMQSGDLDWHVMRKTPYIQSNLHPWLRQYLTRQAQNAVDPYPARLGSHCKWCDYKHVCTAQNSQDGHGAEKATAKRASKKG